MLEDNFLQEEKIDRLGRDLAMFGPEISRTSTRRLYWHVTPYSRLKSILRRGLRPGSPEVMEGESTDRLYFWPEDAYEAVRTSLDWLPRGEKVAILRVEPPSSSLMDLEDDGGSGIGPEISTKSRIPSRYITGVTIYDPGTRSFSSY